MSTIHLIVVRDGLLKDYSFDNLPPQPFDQLEAVCRQAIFAANTAACLRDGGTHGQYQYPYPTSADATEVATSDADYASLTISADDRDEFMVSRTQLESSLYDLSLKISSFFSIDSSGRSAASMAGNNGIVFIDQLCSKRDKIEARAGAALSREWLHHC